MRKVEAKIAGPKVLQSIMKEISKFCRFFSKGRLYSRLSKNIGRLFIVKMILMNTINRNIHL